MIINNIQEYYIRVFEMQPFGSLLEISPTNHIFSVAFQCIKMRYSIEPRGRIYVKGYGFLSFAKNMGKSLSNKYGKKLFDSATKSMTDAIKIASKRAIQKTAEANSYLTGNKIADKITSVSKKSNSNNNNNNEDVELTTRKKRYISPEERQQITNELMLVPKGTSIFKKFDKLILILKNHISVKER